MLPVAHAEYRLGSGDVIEVSVFKVPDLSRRLLVDVEGNVSFPPLGLVDASGSTLDELSRRLRDMLVREDIVRDPRITVALVEARPFFVNGDVAKPGAYPYQSNISVRHAVALAGGYDLSRSRAISNPHTQAVEARTEGAVLWTDLVKSQVRAARLRAELEGKDTFDLQQIVDIPVPQAIISEIVRLEMQNLKVSRDDFDKERSYLDRIQGLTEARLAGLLEQKAKEEEGLQQQMDEVARIRALQEKGLTPTSRISEEQRALLFQQTRVSENKAQIALTQKELEEIKRNIQTLEERRRITLTNELQDAIVSIDKDQTQIAGAMEKMAGISLPDLGNARITLYRTIGNQRIGQAASEETEILPGDLIEISLPLKPNDASPALNRNLVGVQSVKPDPTSSATRDSGEDTKKSGQLAQSGPTDGKVKLQDQDRPVSDTPPTGRAKNAPGNAGMPAAGNKQK